MNKKSSPLHSPASDQSPATDSHLKEKVTDTITHAYEHSKEKVGELYNESVKSICDAEEHLKEYANELVKTIKNKPLTSLLIAGGIGFVISSLLRK